jgi:hypothetical protein
LFSTGEVDEAMDEVDVAGASLLPHPASTNAVVARARVFIKVVIIVIFLFLKKCALVNELSSAY